MSPLKGAGTWALFSFFLLTASSSLAQDSEEALQTREEKESYSIGYQIGQSMKTQSVDVDLEKVILGLQDSVQGKGPRLDPEEMKTLVLDLSDRAEREKMLKFQESIVKNAEESRRFLEENGNKEGIRTTESGLQYIVLRAGDGISPGPEDLVTVHYRGTFTDGTEFDNSYAKGKPQMFRTNAIIKGWTEALQMMKTGSKWKVFLPPDLAYGRRGQGTRIPPNKVLVFEIELLEVKRKNNGSFSQTDPPR